MQYNAKIAKACPHPYYWVAKFTDSEEVAQYTKDGEEVLYREVLNRLDSGKGLSCIELVPLRKDLPLYRQEIDSAWQRPIIFRRHFVPVQEGRRLPERIVYTIGWQATINGKNYKSVTYIDLKGELVLITHRDW